MEIEVKIEGLDQIKSFLNARPERIKEELDNAVKKSLLSVEREAKKRAPVKTGRMRASIQSQVYGIYIGREVFVGVRYAIYVHENLRARHKRGEAKFLENAVRMLKPTIQKYFQLAIKRVAEK